MRQTANQDNRDDRRLKKLEQELKELRHTVAGLGKYTPNVPVSANIRLGKTVGATADTPDYPEPTGLAGSGYTDKATNTYRVELYDHTFTTTPGRQSPTLTDRGLTVVAHDFFGGYVPEGDTVIVAKIPSKKSNTSGEWFIVQGQVQFFLGQLLDIVDTGTSSRGTVALYRGPNTSNTLVVNGATAKVEANYWGFRGGTSTPALDLAVSDLVGVQWCGDFGNDGDDAPCMWQIIAPSNPV